MTVIEIVKDYLEKNGYDGLSNVDGECACLKDELAPCDAINESCEAGYVHKKNACGCSEYFADFDFLITPIKCNTKKESNK